MAEEKNPATKETKPAAQAPAPVAPASPPSPEPATAPAVPTAPAAPAAPAAPPPPAEQPSRTAPPLPEGQSYIWATGRRKKAVARIRMRPGTGKFLVNRREVVDYFTEEKDRGAVISPLRTVSMINSWDIWVNVDGGGSTGQAGAVALGLARAICRAVPDVEVSLRDQGLLTRDARMKERKKYGQKGARKRFQYSKR